MFFWFKKKKIVVDCFTVNSAVYQYAPIQRYKNFYPEYWKNLPKKNPTIDNNGLHFDERTLKACVAFIDLYNNAFAIPLWADLKLSVNEKNEYSWHWSHNGIGDNNDNVVHHHSRQYGDAFKNFTALKIVSPWLIREKRGVKFYWSEPTWNLAHKFGELIKILPGIVSYNVSFTTHINLLAKTGMGEILLPYNTPMATIVPLSEENIEVKNHCVDEKEWKKLYNINFYSPTFNSSFSARSKCPFTGKIKTL